MTASASPVTIVAHDYLTQRGGAERVALEIARQLGAREIITSVFDPANTFHGFDEFTITESTSRALHSLRGDMRWGLPLLAQAWSQMPPVDADVLVCSSSGWAHGLPTTERTKKVVYCHNPARWLYQRADYVTDQSLPVRALLAALTPRLRSWDQRAAQSAQLYVANSVSVAARIERVYGIRAEVLHPPLSIDVTGPRDAVPGVPDEYFLSVSRARGYKGTSLLIDSFARMPERTLVIVGVQPSPSLPRNVLALGNVSEAHLRWLYAHTRALMSMSHEDFGLTPIEANAFGRPALVLRAGGFLDSTVEGVSGLFIDDETVDAVITAVRTFPAEWNTEAIRAAAERFSPASFAHNLREVIAGARAL
ncbi:glycosyltransferase [Cryobacterium sp. 1639]|uniref:glycosyltransferase n=1 Tax=Cryobacterium inferilacus TaxID=2866629 RepID=UPI001C732775|nr:glycosyltransferase [Cryobacterium sp. 1639]MBX0301317.1 glycosyltransferase [Cryobacterium sp. 1639]